MSLPDDIYSVLTARMTVSQVQAMLLAEKPGSVGHGALTIEMAKMCRAGRLQRAGLLDDDPAFERVPEPEPATIADELLALPPAVLPDTQVLRVDGGGILLIQIDQSMVYLPPAVVTRIVSAAKPASFSP